MYENLCEPWPATLCTDICGYSPVVTGAAFLAASNVLWEATGRRFNNCPVVVRPCRADCAPIDDRSVSGWLHPALVDGSWVNVACGICGPGQCGCSSTSEIILPDFARVAQVTVDGVTLGTGDWILYDGTRLVRVGAEWPLCQDWNVVSGAGVFDVLAAFGPEVPDLGKLAVGILGVEIMKQMCGEDCALPFKTVSVSRRGVTMTRDAEGLTGLTIPDLFIKSFNPNKIQDRIRIYSPDLPLPRVTSAASSFYLPTPTPEPEPEEELIIPGPGMLELVGTNALALRTAIAGLPYGGRCNLLFIGNSITERYFATTSERGYAEITVAKVAAGLGVTDPPGYFPASTNTNYTASMAFVPSGTTSQVMDSGFCGEAMYWQANTTLTSVTVNPSTGFWIHCQKGPQIGAGFTYTVNGGAVQGPVTPATGAPRLGGRIWDHGSAGGLNSGGANTIVLSSNAVFGSVIEGITFFNGNHNTTRPQGFITQANANTGGGLRHWICGHFGFRTLQYVTPGFGVATSAALFTDPMEFINPHCVIIELGTNDIVAGVSVTTFMANIATLISMIQTKATAFGFAMPTIIFLAAYGTSADPTDQYLPQALALRSYCTTNGFGLLDLSQLIGDIDGATALTSDNIHPNDTGHAVIANYLSKMILDA